MGDLTTAVTQTVEKFDKVHKEFNSKVKASEPKKAAESKK